VTLVLAIGIFLRFSALRERGLVQWDSCLYANIAKTPIYTWDYVLQNVNNFTIDGLLSFLKDNGCLFVGIRPAHTFSILLSFLILGIKEWAVLAPSAGAGTLTVLVAYLFGKRFFSKEVGLLAAAIIAVSGFQVAFSRTGYPQSLVLLFSACLTYFYFLYREEGKPKYLYFSGAFLSLGFLSHPSIIVTALPIFVDFTILFLRDRSRLEIKTVLKLVSVVIAPLLFEEIIFVFAHFISPGENIKGAVLWQLFQYNILSSSGQGATMFEGLRFFYDMMVITDGYAWTFFYLASIISVLIFCIKKRNRLLLLLLAQLLVPFWFWSWKYPTVKAINVCYLPLSILSGYALWNALSWFRQQEARLTLALGLLAISLNYSFLWGQLEFRIENYKVFRMAKEVLEREGGVLRADEQENLGMVLKFYMPLMNRSKSRKLTFGNQNTYHYYLITYKQIEKHSEYVREIQNSGQLVFSERYLSDYIPITVNHRLKNKGFEFVNKNIDDSWYEARLYRVNSL
jgi:4-amino-4-deoxy-L-arabinose transferase-like glycosyltransferase